MHRSIICLPAWLAAWLVPAFLAGPLQAATLSLDTGASLSLQPGGTGSLTLALSNDAGDVTNFNGWVLGIQYLPATGATGSLTLQSLTQPLINPAVTNSPASPLLDPDVEMVNFDGDPLFVNGSDFFTTISITSANSNSVQTLAGSTTYNLGTLTFAASPDALGTWNLFAINPNADDGERTYWYSNGLNSFSYGNLPIAAAGEPANSIQLGTISVVPEPGSLMLVGSAIVAAGWYSWRSRRLSGVVQA